MSETDIVNDIRLRVSDEFEMSFLLRNNNGVLQDRFGNYVTYGLGVGTSDLIGPHSVIVTPQMVGRRVAIFTAVEVKKLRARTQKKRLQMQTDFIARVKAVGGLAGFARTYDEVRQILNHACE